MTYTLQSAAALLGLTEDQVLALAKKGVLAIDDATQMVHEWSVAELLESPAYLDQAVADLAS
jgi:hypothetical protein